MMVKPLNHGTLHIADEVVALITEAVVKDTEGVTGTVSGFREGFVRAVGKRPVRGVMVSNDDDDVVVDVKISVTYGVNLSDVCYRLQETIKREVEMIAGVSVGSVNVYVAQMTFGT